MVSHNTIITSADVTITNITWSRTRDGISVPTIHFDEIILSHLCVKSVSLSAEFIHKHNIEIGTIITVSITPEIIPRINV